MNLNVTNVLAGVEFKLDVPGLAFMLAAAPRVAGYWLARAIGRTFTGYKKALRNAYKGKIGKLVRRATFFDGWPPARRPEVMLAEGNDAWRRVQYQFRIRTKTRMGQAVIGLSEGSIVRPRHGKFLRIPVQNLRIGKGLLRAATSAQMRRGGGQRDAGEFILGGVDRIDGKTGGLVVRREGGRLQLVALLMKQVQLPKKIFLHAVWNSLERDRQRYLNWAADQIVLFLAGKPGQSSQVNALTGSKGIGALLSARAA